MEGEVGLKTVVLMLWWRSELPGSEFKHLALLVHLFSGGGGSLIRELTYPELRESEREGGSAQAGHTTGGTFFPQL